jgi:hypothetical protein
MISRVMMNDREDISLTHQTAHSHTPLLVQSISDNRSTISPDWIYRRTIYLNISNLQNKSQTFTLSSFVGGGTVKKADATIYTVFHPIETCAWRANLIAWADESGILLFDIESMSHSSCRSSFGGTDIFVLRCGRCVLVFCLREAMLC